MKRIIVVIILASLVGCTDAGWGKLTALGDKAHIECYSGGKLIFDGMSTGKVSSEASSDGYYFVDNKTSNMTTGGMNLILIILDIFITL